MWDEVATVVASLKCSCCSPHTKTEGCLTCLKRTNLQDSLTSRKHLEGRRKPRKWCVILGKETTSKKPQRRGACLFYPFLTQRLTESHPTIWWISCLNNKVVICDVDRLSRNTQRLYVVQQFLAERAGLALIIPVLLHSCTWPPPMHGNVIELYTCIWPNRKLGMS